MQNLKLSLSLTVLALGGYFFSEWLFFITKPSFFSPLGITDSVGALFATVAVSLLVGLLPLAVFYAILHLATMIPGWNRLRYLTNAVYLSIPAFVLTCIVLLLVDNFSYTLFKFNSGDSSGLTRLIYCTAFLAILIIIFRWLWRYCKKVEQQRGQTWLHVSSLSIIFLSLMSLALAFQHQTVDQNPQLDLPVEGGDAGLNTPEASLPNILVFSSDGINARNMSVYGYRRETTPFIDSISEEALVFENVFVNSSATTGSIASLLTGKSPMTTKVTSRPDVLRGEHRYKHFVGFLKNAGYYTVDIGVPWYADARSLGMQDAFELTAENFYIHRQFLPEILVYELSALLAGRLDVEAQFIQQTSKRIQERLYHLLGFRQMDNVFTNVTLREAGALSDARRLAAVKSVIESAERPWFVHVHFLDTHGPKFTPINKRFSESLLQIKDWDIDFYDDSIRDYDDRVKQTFDLLSQTGQLDNTIITLTSDHGMQHNPIERVPLILFFPDRAYTGRRIHNVQRLDIPPTVLDYLNMKRPDWMEGVSVLRDEPDRHRVIYATAAPEQQQSLGQVRDYRGPFFGMGGLTTIQCQEARLLILSNDLEKQPEAFIKASVPEHSAPCSTDNLATDRDVMKEIGELLYMNGYPEPYVTKFGYGISGNSRNSNGPDNNYRP